MTNVTRVVLLRHGESEDNVSGLLSGWRESELTARGREQARLAARYIFETYRPSVVYTSPLRRARQTAEPLGQLAGVPPIDDANLREQHFGAVEGLTAKEVAELFQEHLVRAQNVDDVEFGWPGGERRADFYRRVRRAIDTIVERHPNQSVVAVSHGGALGSLLAEFIEGKPTRWRNYQLVNSGIVELEAGTGQIAVVRWNVTVHLDPVEQVSANS